MYLSSGQNEAKIKGSLPDRRYLSSDYTEPTRKEYVPEYHNERLVYNDPVASNYGKGVLREYPNYS